MKLALVTGGTRRLGAAIAGRLAQDGWALALHYGHDAAMDEHLADLLARTGVPWHCFGGDLSEDGAPAELLDRVRDHYGEMPVLLVNNAALFGDDDAVRISAISLARHQAVNVNAPILLACQLAAALQHGARSCVVNILDQRIAQPHGDQLSYTFSKQALAESTRTLAVALAPKLRVNAVAPGLTLATADYSAAQLDRLASMMPLEALPDQAAIADAVAYLANAQHVTGQTIFVDGGAHLKSFGRDFIHLARD